MPSIPANGSGSPAAPRVRSARGERHRVSPHARHHPAPRVARHLARVHRGLRLNDARAAPSGAAGCYPAVESSTAPSAARHHRCPHHAAGIRETQTGLTSAATCPTDPTARSSQCRTSLSVAAPEVEARERAPPPNINPAARRGRTPRTARRPHDPHREERMSLRFSRPDNGPVQPRRTRRHAAVGCNRMLCRFSP